MGRGTSGLSGGSGLSKIKMPELKGSEKQVKWAESIRKSVVDEYEDFINSDELRDSYGNYAETVFSQIYSRGLFDGYSLPKSAGKAKSKLERVYNENHEQWVNARKENGVNIDDYMYPIYEGKVKNNANKVYDKYHNIYKAEKAKGNINKSLLQKAKIERAKVYKKAIHDLIKEQVEAVDSASIWINQYKGTKHSR